MSWLLAAFGQDPSSFSGRLSGIHPTPLVKISTDFSYLAAGGLNLTCLSSALTGQEERGWIVLGTGIRLNNGSCTLLSASEWNEILSRPTPPLKDLDGHFVALRWNGANVECFADRFGLRTLFIVPVKNRGVVLSTRLDWLSRARGGLEINFGQCGAHWLTFNQFSHKSLLHGVERLGPGGKAMCTPTGIDLQADPWIPSQRPATVQEVVAVVNSLLHPRSGRTLSLGLSGGLDSRLLLALLQSAGDAAFELHSFGNALEPDVKTARRIALHEHLPFREFDDALPRADDLVTRLGEYIAQTYLVAPASLWTKLRYYPRLHAGGKIMVDGGMGEIARRQFLNRLLYRGRSAMLSGDPRLLFRYVSIPRASIFTREMDLVMRDGAMRQLEVAWNDMPPPLEIGPENFLDLLVVRYRFPNYGGVDQVRMDGEVVSYMPFAQPSFVEAAFGTSLPLKKNGRMFRRLIRERRPALTRYPLVKGTTTYPFVLPTVPAWMYTHLKERLGITYRDGAAEKMLGVLSEFVQDLVESSGVKTCPYYDHASIKRAVTRFYAGESRFASEVDWWLTYELWRQGLQGG